MPSLRTLFRGPRPAPAPSTDREPAPAADVLREMSTALVASLKARNDEMDLAGHAQRVAELADRLAARQGIPGELRAVLRRAAMLHEVGMIGVPRELLHGTRPLTAEETARLHAHAEVGAAIVRGTCGDLAATLVRHQHDDEPTLARVLGEGTDAYRLTLLLRAADVADVISRAPELRFVPQTMPAAKVRKDAEAEALAA